MEPKFYICRKCGNLAGMLHKTGCTPTCCGDEMELLVPNTVEASQEKHLPVATVEGDIVTVNVGSADHPMLPEHNIGWVYLQTDKGGQRKILNPGDAPHVTFALGGDKPVAVYAYCNLHGLWKTEL